MTTPETLQALLEELPFYVNGTATAEVRNQIDAALPSSEELRQALEEERHVQSRLLSGTGEILDSSERQFQLHKAAIMAKIAQPAPTEVPQTKNGFASALAFLNPRRWNPAIALTLALAIPAQAAVIAAQSSTITKLEKENFELASGPCADRDRTSGIVLELNDNASWNAVAELLDQEALVIIDSAAFGVLTVRGEKKGDQRQALIEQLKTSPLVKNAEPEA